MAGPFSFDKDKYAVSIAFGGRVLLPAARTADAESDGLKVRLEHRHLGEDKN
jgi:hypothetical protein